MPDHQPHTSDAAVRKLIDSLADGSFGEGHEGGQSSARTARLAALGPVTSLEHLQSDERGDTHRVTFSQARLLCTTERDETGNITHFELVLV